MAKASWISDSITISHRAMQTYGAELCFHKIKIQIYFFLFFFHFKSISSWMLFDITL